MSKIATYKSLPLLSLFLILGSLLSLSLLKQDKTISALDNDFSNGITVDSTLDTPDDSITNGPGADSICDDGAGNCTLRAAIQEANSNPDITNINFNITEPADFTNRGEDGYTISVTSSLPEITEPARIDGYSQPGAAPNTAISPSPLNGILLIELDLNSNISIMLNADGIRVSGLVINNSSATGVIVGGDGIELKGNYIGTDPTGMVEVPNQLNGINSGFDQGTDDPDDLTIGGTNPADRNIISGNNDSAITPNTGDDNWVIQGNYIGLGADGLTSLPNSYLGGPGGMSVDNCSGTLIGGTVQGSVNVISGNNSFGIFPDNTTNLVVQGNIIGPDWKGDPLQTNPQPGGIGLPSINGPFSDTLIGGTTAQASNLIAHNNGTGVAVVEPSFLGTLLYPSKEISILGNRIFGNSQNINYPLSNSGLGIDLLEAEISDFSVSRVGPDSSDAGDSDSGPNDLINYPSISSVYQNNNNLDISFTLDAYGSPVGQYRVEFFSNDVSDMSGYGEGQEFIGYTEVPNGQHKISVDMLSSNSIVGKYISSTTTSIDPGTAHGYASTSEFSFAVVVSENLTPTQASTMSKGLAETGQETMSIYLTSLSLIFLSTLLTVPILTKR